MESTDLRLERIGSQDVADWESVMLEALGMPPAVAPFLGATIGTPGWHHYLSYDGETAVGGGATAAGPPIWPA